MYRTAFRKPAGLVFLPQPFYGCLFQDGLAVRNAVQFGIQCMSLDWERIIFSNPFFERQLFHALKEFLKVVSWKTAELNENPFRSGKTKVCHCQKVIIAPE